MLHTVAQQHISVINLFFLPFLCLQSNLTDSECSSLSALNMSEDDFLEDNIMDNSFESSQLYHSPHQGDWKWLSTAGFWTLLLFSYCDKL